ncbi:MAG: hypothetical protein HQ522_19415 [Bacteroidetes bacterium]|nr:hypothetical protein [Bacteroidota bacterium]
MNQKTKITGANDFYYLLAFFFVLTFGYFHWVADYLLFFQEKQSLFVFSSEYFHEFLSKPGGLLELAGKFLTQFYLNTVIGSFILATTLTLTGTIFFKISKRLFIFKSGSLLFMLIPSCLLLMMQTHYYHKMEYNLGFLLVLLYFLLSILPGKKYNRYFALTLFPLFYYLAGAYSWIFLVMYIFYNLSFEKERQQYSFSVFLLSTALVSFVVFKEVLFLQSVDQLIQYPLPFVDDSKHRITFYLLTCYIALYPLAGKIIFSIRLKRVNTRFVALTSAFFIFSITIFSLYKAYNPQTARALQLEKLVFEENWAQVIELHENYPSKNLIGQYCYNIALSETDQLCDRLLYGRQDFSANSLILPWSNEYLRWGAYFFYSVGLINEAHRWAYEEMVVYGYRPQNIKLLAKTNLINGNYQMAKKYIDILKKTINYNDWAKEYEKLLNLPKRIASYPELGEKIKILPKEDFFIEIDNPQNNITLLLKANPNNRKAFEYEMSWLLLTKNVGAVVTNIKKMKELGYTRIPLHVEEAALAYLNSTGELPYLGGLTISHETQTRFGEYVSTFKSIRQNSSSDKEKMRENFGNTYWYYFHSK